MPREPPVISAVRPCRSSSMGCSDSSKKGGATIGKTAVGDQRFPCFPATLQERIMQSELFEKGLVVRKEVLGAEYVDKSIKGADDFALAMQEYATEAAWGSIWTRPGLPRKTRSLLNIAMLTIMNRQHELKLHIRSSFTNGVTKDEIKEVLLQVAA